MPHPDSCPCYVRRPTAEKGAEHLVQSLAPIPGIELSVAAPRSPVPRPVTAVAAGRDTGPLPRLAPPSPSYGGRSPSTTCR